MNASSTGNPGRCVIHSLICASLIAVGFSAAVFAEASSFYFCSAASDDKKTYYFTKLFDGKFRISTAREFKADLDEKYGREFSSAKCLAYGSAAKPLDLKTAEKLWRLEIKKNSVVAQSEVVDWTPG